MTFPGETLESISATFAAQFGRPAEAVARAPGRVNLIGEHVDYCDGLVLPIAVRQSIWVAVSPREDRRASVVAADLGERHEWLLGEWRRGVDPHWSSYVAGAAELLRRRRAHLGGFDLLVRGDVPRGGGLSSSAALTMAATLALASLAGEPLDSGELVELCRNVEHEFAGVPCGVMDPAACRMARSGCALLLDCRSMEAEHVPLDLSRHALLVADSGVRHELASSDYAARREECERALAYFRRIQPSVTALRDVSFQTARAHAGQMDPLLAARALHVTGEIERVVQAAAALKRRDLAAFGSLMWASHESLRDHYQASCGEVDAIVDRLLVTPGVLGARMTGGGWGGCVVALVERDAAERVAALLTTPGPRGKALATGCLRVEAGAGASIERA